MQTSLEKIICFLRKITPSFIFHLIPEKVFLAYHALINMFFHFYFRRPSRELIVIGVTGTNGKTSTTILVREILQSASIKTGLLGTVQISIGSDIKPNPVRSTMIGRGFIHKQLRKMVTAGCKVAIIETTSEGIKQYRHIGIAYDILVFTNLTPEHLQSHKGSFELYKQTKMSIFKKLHTQHRKDIPKIIIANTDDSVGKEFLAWKADKKVSFGIDSGDIRAHDVVFNDGTTFSLSIDGNDEFYKTSLLGKFNVYNILASIAVSKQIGLTYPEIKAGVESVDVIPGRMESIDEGQNFLVLVDYAHEGAGMENALGSLQHFRKHNKVISVIGGVGGGRDRRNRFEIGRIASNLSDFVVITTTDPYEETSAHIIEDVLSASKKAGSILNQDVFVEDDRKKGIRKAFSLAQKGDVVIITGKGAELSMVVMGELVPWNERQIVRDVLRDIDA